MPGNWYHVVCNYGNNNMELYLNGSLIGSLAANVPGSVSSYNNTIGKDYNVSLNRAWYYGVVDQVLFYNRKLTSTEVLAIYNRESSSNEITELQGPVSYFYDASGNRTGRNVISLLKSGNITYRQDTTQLKSKAKVEESIMPKYEESIEGELITIFPNPTKNILKVNITGMDLNGKTIIRLYDIKGTMLINISPVSQTNVLDLSQYSAGVYILKYR
ncbi:MAG: T9SS type A sorting domain-containing protein [Bacteroidales bacterium]|nr:T9SS type A sorting domain-containing protein [Bacteroidales bacterium]